MKNQGDKIMRVQHRYKKNRKKRVAEIRCILCGQWPMKGHDKMCPEHPDNKKIIEQ